MTIIGFVGFGEAGREQRQDLVAVIEVPARVRRRQHGLPDNIGRGALEQSVERRQPCRAVAG